MLTFSLLAIKKTHLQFLLVQDLLFLVRLQIEDINKIILSKQTGSRIYPPPPTHTHTHTHTHTASPDSFTDLVMTCFSSTAAIASVTHPQGRYGKSKQHQ